MSEEKKDSNEKAQKPSEETREYDRKPLSEKLQRPEPWPDESIGDGKEKTDD